MFTKRHEQELIEIKALTYELDQRFQEILEELEHIKEAQAQLAAQDRQARGGKPKSGRRRAKLLDDETPGPHPTGGKKARSRQPSTAVVGADTVGPGKRQERATAKSGSRPSKQTTKGRRGVPVRGARPIKRSADNSRRG